MSLKGLLHFVGIVDAKVGVYSWVLYDNAGNKLTEESGYSIYNTKEKVEYHALIQGLYDKYIF